MISRHLQPLLDRIHQMLGTGEADARSADASASRSSAGASGRCRAGSSSSSAKRCSRAGGCTCATSRAGAARSASARCRRSGWSTTATPGTSMPGATPASACCALHSTPSSSRSALETRPGRCRSSRSRRRWTAATASTPVPGATSPRCAFQAQAAPWVSREQWHPDQHGRWLDDGRYELDLPYADETEIVMDILRQGPQVEVVRPASLRKRVGDRLREACAIFRRDRRAGPPRAGGISGPTRPIGAFSLRRGPRRRAGFHLGRAHRQSVSWGPLPGRGLAPCRLAPSLPCEVASCRTGPFWPLPRAPRWSWAC